MLEFESQAAIKLQLDMLPGPVLQYLFPVNVRFQSCFFLDLGSYLSYESWQVACIRNCLKIIK